MSLSQAILFDYSHIDTAAAHALLSTPRTAIDTRCQHPTTLVLGVYDGLTFLVDEKANLWDIHPMTKQLSILSVAKVSDGIDGFAVSIASNAILSPDTVSQLHAMKNYLTPPYYEQLCSQYKQYHPTTIDHKDN